MQQDWFDSAWRCKNSGPTRGTQHPSMSRKMSVSPAMSSFPCISRRFYHIRQRREVSTRHRYEPKNDTATHSRGDREVRGERRKICQVTALCSIGGTHPHPSLHAGLHYHSVSRKWASTVKTLADSAYRCDFLYKRGGSK